MVLFLTCNTIIPNICISRCCETLHCKVDVVYFCNFDIFYDLLYFTLYLRLLILKCCFYVSHLSAYLWWSMFLHAKGLWSHLSSLIKRNAGASMFVHQGQFILYIWSDPWWTNIEAPVQAKNLFHFKKVLCNSAEYGTLQSHEILMFVCLH